MPQKEPKQEKNEIIDISDHDGIGNAVDNLNNTPKQETLEEAAERYADFSNDYVPMAFGGKFNQTTKRDFIKGAKWQQERMYSEEEILDIIHKCGKYCYDSKKIGTDIGLMPNLLIGFFEQFKKK